MYKGLLTHSLLCSKFVELTLFSKLSKIQPNETDHSLLYKYRQDFVTVVKIFRHHSGRAKAADVVASGIHRLHSPAESGLMCCVISSSC